MTNLNRRLMPIPQTKSIPRPDASVGLKALQGIRQRSSILGALEVMHREVGDVFRLPVPGFNPVVLAGPKAARFVLATARDDLRWRMDHEPIHLLLRRGLLMQDGADHDALRRVMSPALHRRMLTRHTHAMIRAADYVSAGWQDGDTRDMLTEMRKVALIVLTDALFGVDFTPDLERLWPGVLRAVNYISPGPWVLWRGLSRVGYDRSVRLIDAYLYRVIEHRRDRLSDDPDDDDLLGALIRADLDPDLIRDQLMTMLIAGHDTSTASLAWTLALLGAHPEAMTRVRSEVDNVLGPHEAPCIECVLRLGYLAQVIDESLRLYPPIHLGSRFAATDLIFDGYHIPAGSRVLYSIYLTHRHPDHWRDPDTFDPSRFAPDVPRPAPYTFLPFGGGPRNCIGAAFAQVEVKVVLARLLQRFDLTLPDRGGIHPHMGATLEPRPGVPMHIRRH